MALPLILAGVGGGLGLLKGIHDTEDSKKNRELQAATALYSPWTKMSPDMQSLKANPSVLGNALTGAFGGYSQGVMLDKAIAETGAIDRSDSVASPISSTSGGTLGYTEGVPNSAKNPWTSQGELEFAKWDMGDGFNREFKPMNKYSYKLRD